MGCELCGKTEVPLYKGLFDNRVVFACNECVNLEGVMVIGKPSKEQLEKAEKRDSVRETMERLSGHYMKRPIANIDHTISDRALEKIKVIPKAGKVDELMDNYDWEIRMARRRKKMTANDLAKATGISLENIDRIEKGYLPKDFPTMIEKIEKALNVRLLKETNTQTIKFHLPKQEENIDLERMRRERQIELEKRKEMQAKTTLDLTKHKIEEKVERQIIIPKTRTQIAMERLHSIDKPRGSKDVRRNPREVRDNSFSDRKVQSGQDLTGDEIELDE